MKTLTIFAISLIFIFTLSCKEQTIDSPEKRSSSIENVFIEKGMLSFSSEKDYINKVRDINLSKEEIERLDSKGEFRSMMLDPESLDEFEQNHLAGVSATFLNKDKRVIVGDLIYLFHRGNIYTISKETVFKSNLLNEDILKQGKKAGNYKKTIIGDFSKKALTSIGGNAVDASHQHEFVQQYPSVGNRKYVHELYSLSITYPSYVMESKLFLRLKMEWRGCCGWKPAGEARYYGCNVTGSVTFTNVSGGSWSNTQAINVVQGSGGSTVNTDVPILLYYYGGAPGTVTYDVTLNGHIWQQVAGDSQSYWYNSGYPLW